MPFALHAFDTEWIAEVVSWRFVRVVLNPDVVEAPWARFKTDSNDAAGWIEQSSSVNPEHSSLEDFTVTATDNCLRHVSAQRKHGAE
jgi:hypothetical protein